MQREPIIISDTVYTRCAIQHDKSLTVNCLILFMMYTTDTKLKCPVDRLNLLCCDTASGLATALCSSTKASGHVNSSSAACALCGIGIAAHVATFLVNIFHLSRSRLYLASLEKASPKTTWLEMIRYLFSFPIPIPRLSTDPKPEYVSGYTDLCTTSPLWIDTIILWCASPYIESGE